MTLQQEMEAYNRARAVAVPQRMVGIRFQSAAELADWAAPRRLINCDLRGLDLREIDLSYCIFDACNFSGARLRYCQHSLFYSCDLRQAKLTGADFRWVKALNCRIDGADLIGIQTTVDCHFWAGLRSDLAQDGYLLLYWMSAASPITQDLAAKCIPDRVKAFLDREFSRDVAS